MTYQHFEVCIISVLDRKLTTDEIETFIEEGIYAIEKPTDECPVVAIVKEVVPVLQKSQVKDPAESLIYADFIKNATN